MKQFTILPFLFCCLSVGAQKPELMLPTGHGGIINYLSISNDGRYVYSAGNREIKVWEMQTGNLLKTHYLPIIEETYFPVAFLPGSRKVLIINYDGIGIWTWQPEKNDIQHFDDLKVQHWGNYITSPLKDQLLSSNENGEMVLFDMNSGKIKFTLKKGGQPVIFSDIRGLSWDASGKYVLTGHESGEINLWNTENGNWKSNLQTASEDLFFSHQVGFSVPESSSATARYAFSAMNDQVKILELENPRIVADQIPLPEPYCKGISCSADGSQLWVAASNIFLIDVGTKTVIDSLTLPGFELQAAYFSPDGKYAVAAYGGKGLQDLEGKYVVSGTEVTETGLSYSTRIIVWDLATLKPVRTFGDRLTNSIIDVHPSIKGDKFFFTAGTPKVWDLKKGGIQSNDIKTTRPAEESPPYPSDYPAEFIDYQLTKDGKKALLMNNSSFALWNVEKKIIEHKFDFPDMGDLEEVILLNNGRTVLLKTWQNWEQWDVVKGEMTQYLTKPGSWGTEVGYLNEKTFYLDRPNAITLHDAEKDKELATLVTLGENDWLVTTPSGLFDASPGAMAQLYYTVGLEVIGLDQLKERYWEPGLLQKLLGFKNEEIRDVSKFDQVDLFPSVMASIKEDRLDVQLSTRNGGIGKVSFFINQKEVLEDANSDRKNELSIDLKNYAKYYRFDTVNVLSLRSYNSDGWLKSQAYNLSYTPVFRSSRGEGGEEDDFSLSFSHDPKLFAVVVGTSDYNGNQLDLRYADKDAKSIAAAIQQAALPLFGVDHVNVQFLSTEKNVGSTLPSKENIKTVFTTIAKEANPDDVLLIYLAGHGINFGGEQSQFYYLTKDMTSGDLNDKQIRSAYAISSGELTEWIKSIAAQKQILIIDACNSGKAAEDLIAQRDIPSNQVRALDRMKDRTGMFVLAGSAANRVSYEATQFGQGLLTYSLLLGMKQRLGKTVDVMELFQFARDKVPEFASMVGGIQTPMMAFPTEAASFPIGLVTKDVVIPLEEIKPVFVQSRFQEEVSIDDVAGLEQAMDDHLLGLSTEAMGIQLIFVDTKAYENAYSIKGRYHLDGDAMKVKVYLFKGQEKVDTFEVSGNSSDLTAMATKIADKALELIENK